MKSTIRRSTFKAIYRLYNKVSPMDGDCGLLCGAACCDNERALIIAPHAQFGMYLLPGEEKVFTRKEPWLNWSVERAEECDYPDSWRGIVYFVQCKGPDECDRRMRPIQCRSFPLTPHIDPDGGLRLLLYPEKLPYACPIISRRLPMTKGFISVTYTIWKRLLRDPLIYDLVKKESEQRESRKTDIRSFTVQP